MSDDPLPELRASDADRERTAEVLRRAAGEGRLTMEELEERLHSTYEARTHRGLEGLTRDVEMTVFSLMGGAEIRVPEGLNVEVSEFAFMGGNDVHLGDELPDPGGPVLRLRLLSILGGTDVKRGRKRSRRERLRERSRP